MAPVANRRIIGAVFSVCVLAVAAIIVYLAWTSYGDQLRDTQTVSHNYATIIEARLDATFRRAEAHLQELAQSLPREAFDKTAVRHHAPTIDAGLDMRRLHFPELVGLRVWDRHADLLYASESKNTPRINVADRDYFQAASQRRNGEIFFSDATVSRITGRSAMFLARGVHDEQGALLGVVTASVEIEHFIKLFQSLDVGRAGAISVFRRDNFKLVARWPQVDNAEQFTLPASNPIRAAVTAGARTGASTHASPLDGVERLSSFVALERYPFHVTVGIALEDALATWKSRWIAIGLASLMLIALLAGMMYYLQRAEKNLERLNADLEQRVTARTLELETAKAAAEEANNAKSQFVSNMSHEIRTPLSSVLGMAELLQDTPLNAEQRAYLQSIAASGRTLHNLLSDILDLAKIEARKIEIERINFDPVAMVIDMGDAYRELAAEHGSVLTVDLDPHLPRLAAGDPTRLRQVLSNLVGNAVKFTEGGAITVAARRIAKPGDEQHLWVGYSVADTGIGMSDAVMSKLFEPFVQGDSSTTRHYGGSGLGLAISKHLVQIMGGTIHMQSAPGKGTALSFELPLGMPLAGVQTAARETPLGPFRARVLVAEDKPDNQEIFRVMLTKLGADVTVVDNGERAVQAVQAMPFDLVLMDIQMPVMNGYEATRRIRDAHKSGPRVPIVAVTANVMASDRQRCLDAGMDDYMAKPVSVAKLRGLLAQWLGPPPPA